MQFIQTSSQPKLLVLSGTHGDEYGVIASVQKYLEEHTALLPDYLYVPEMSPSAVQAKTRENAEGYDLNRHFTTDSSVAEVQEAIALLSPFTFNIVLNFHEDYERTRAAYIYDSHMFSDELREKWIDHASTHGVKLFTGIDDASDPILSNHIQDGYLGTYDADRTYDSGFFQDWALSSNIVKRSFILEIPGAAPQEEKDRITAALFTFFLEHIL